MQLLTQELRRKLPPLRATSQEKDPMVICKFFFPDFHWTWYAIEFDGEDTFFGFVDGDFPELGYFSLSELLIRSGRREEIKTIRNLLEEHKREIEHVLEQIENLTLP